MESRTNLESIDPPIMNAACSAAKEHEDVRALCETDIGAVVLGSITVEEREGNQEPRQHEGKGFMLNSFGMPNNGAEYYHRHLPEMVKRVHESGKRFMLNAAGFSRDEYVELARMGSDAGADFIELNFGCPNVSEGGKQKPIVSFDPEKMEDIIHAVGAVTDVPLVCKLSPYSNPAELAHVAETIGRTNRVAGVTTMNTFPNGVMLEEGEPVLASGTGGVSGTAMLPIGLGQVWQFRQHLPEDIAVVGVGGIESREDVNLYLQAGASAVQAATLIVRNGHQAIDRLNECLD